MFRLIKNAKPPFRNISGTVRNRKGATLSDTAYFYHRLGKNFHASASGKLLRRILKTVELRKIFIRIWSGIPFATHLLENRADFTDHQETSRTQRYFHNWNLYTHLKIALEINSWGSITPEPDLRSKYLQCQVSPPSGDFCFLPEKNLNHGSHGDPRKNLRIISVFEKKLVLYCIAIELSSCIEANATETLFARQGRWVQVRGLPCTLRRGWSAPWPASGRSEAKAAYRGQSYPDWNEMGNPIHFGGIIHEIKLVKHLFCFFLPRFICLRS